MARLRLCINFDYNIDDSITLRELGNRNNGSINQLMRSCLHKRIQCQGMNKVISSSYSQWQHRRPIPSLAIIGPLPLQTRIPARYIHYHDHAKKFLSLYTRPVPFTPYRCLPPLLLLGIFFFLAFISFCVLGFGCCITRPMRVEELWRWFAFLLNRTSASFMRR